MLEKINNICFGYIAVPVIVALRKKGFFSLLEQEGALTSEELSVRLCANVGCLRIALHLLESIGWLNRNPQDEYTLTQTAASLQTKIPTLVSDLYQYSSTQYLHENLTDQLQIWLEQSNRQWGVSDE